MLDRSTLFRILYALTARDGREERLFGPNARLAHEAFDKSLVGDAFPEVWFELPLAGEPWLDLHALTSHEGLRPDTVFDSRTCGGCPEAFEWFASRGGEARQLALSWDTSTGVVDVPAIQLLVATDNPDVTCDFLAAIGRSDAMDDYRAFVGRLPKDWFACYAGSFAMRPDHHLRVECIPNAKLQRRYATDPALLEKHLRQVGMTELGDTIVPRCQMLADTPFKLEFQFDVMPGGVAGPTLGASLRFDCPPGAEDWGCFDPEGEAGELMRQVEDWGLADDRWRLLAEAMFAKRVAREDAFCKLYCFPAFVKLRWKHGAPLDAKAYLLLSQE